MEKISLIASIVSILISFFAVWLSITFFKMSKEENAKIKEASDRIASDVGKLENIFNRFYDDTWEIMRDTVIDMRRHIWPDDGSNKQKLLNISELKKDIINQLCAELKKGVSEILKEQEINKSKSQAIQQDIQGKVVEDIARRIEAILPQIYLEKAKQLILSSLEIKPAIGLELYLKVVEDNGVPSKYFFEIISKLKEQGIIEWEGEKLNPFSKIILKTAKLNQ